MKYYLPVTNSRIIKIPIQIPTNIRNSIELHVSKDTDETLYTNIINPIIKIPNKNPNSTHNPIKVRVS